ncbi:hypothetical protein BaRGS_00010028 [Batillaria attramentaria]|uniref:Apple domain-containing protein n=1 Tax=Batillaria attramentaria TaxID=370345 RepID=A0ABD0LHC2_9CAEN
MLLATLTATSVLVKISLGGTGLMASVHGVVYEHELYARKDNTNRSVACGICEARGGHLARRPELDDWEIAFGNLSHLDTMDFWVDLVKTDTDLWYWGDGVAIDPNEVSYLPMTPQYNQTYTGWACAVWNMAEPFYMPAACSVTANVICEVPTTEPATFEGCKTQCEGNTKCWMADYQSSKEKCRLMIQTDRPPVPTMSPHNDFQVIARTCVKYREMSAEESQFACNCGAMDMPETEEEFEKFVEEYKEEVKKELVVPKDTLSATVRKKVSAPDERQSSTGIGALGVAMMAVVFGGLILMDLTTVFAHVKMAAGNVREVFVNGTEGSTDA